MLSVTLRQIDYACAVARHGGLTAAAEALHVSQPALSVALALVEAHLGQPLYLRRPGGPMVPTAFGRGWLAEAERHLAATTRLLSGATQSAPLRLAVFEDIAPLILASLLANLTDPAITPRIMGFDALTEALHSGQTDLAVTWDLGLPPDIRRITLHRAPPQAIMPPDHPLARNRALTLADLAGYPLVLTDQGQSLDHLRALFSRAGLQPRIAHRTATLDLMRSFAANGLGIGLSYSQPAPRISADGMPFVLLPITDAGQEPVILALPAGAADPQGLTALCRRLSDLLQLSRPSVAAFPQPTPR
ncbi:MAG: LysR family transcriptional regulator [bacterium]